MQQKSRILVFTTVYRPMIGGSEIALEEIISRLPDIFFDIVTSKYKRDFKTLEAGSNFNIHRIGFGLGIIDKVIFPVTGCLRAISLIRDNHHDAIHAYQASYGGGAAWLVKMLGFRLPFLLTMQEGKNLDRQPLLINWLRGLIIKKADAITVISNYLGEYVRKISPYSKVFLIPNGVDLKKFQTLGSQLQISLGHENQKENQIITVSRLVPKNGVDDIIKATGLLKNKYNIPNIKLIIVGDGRQREELFRLVKELGLENNVEFLGSISNEKINGYLASSSVFVRPSLSEGLGTAFIEAMAAGVPIIGTPVGGIPDFLKDQATGLFCKPNDPQDLADKINRILTNKDLSDELIRDAHILVEDTYDWDKIAIKFRDLYLKTINRES